MNIQLLMFRHDLRVHDNRALVAALQAGRVVACYDERPRFVTRSLFGQTFRPTAKRCQQYGIALAHLQQQLLQLNIPLYHIEELPTTFQVETVFYTKLFGTEELAEEASWRKRWPSAQWQSFDQHTLYETKHLPFRVADVPNVFTSFRRQVERVTVYHEPLSIPAEQEYWEWPSAERITVPEWQSDVRSSFPFPITEAAALQHVQQYVWQKKRVATYKETRNELTGVDFSTKFSPFLAHGVVSPRYIMQQIKAFEAQYGANESTYWIYFELLWRDYFHFVLQQHGARLFQRDGIQQKRYEAKRNDQAFQLWCAGETGYPLVDAAMKELVATGFMSNRARQNVASFLIHELRLDWRLGALFFEQQLLDYDPACNYGNWQYIAGVGNDPRPVRAFNVVKQGEQYDRQRRFLRVWLPEATSYERRER